MGWFTEKGNLALLPHGITFDGKGAQPILLALEPERFDS